MLTRRECADRGAGVSFRVAKGVRYDMPDALRARESVRHVRFASRDATAGVGIVGGARYGARFRIVTKVM
jgi:hypothetical protein